MTLHGWPDSRRRPSDGLVVEASIVARLLRARLLTGAGGAQRRRERGGADGGPPLRGAHGHRVRRRGSGV